METYCQLFYSRFVQFPKEALRTPEVRSQIARAARIIKQKDGRDQCRYFLNLMTLTDVFDRIGDRK